MQVQELEDKLKALQGFQAIKSILQDKYQSLDVAFLKIDKNESGFIELDDLRDLVLDDERFQDPKVINGIFQLVNKSGTGKITLDEFESIWTSIDRDISLIQNKINFEKEKSSNEPSPNKKDSSPIQKVDSPIQKVSFLQQYYQNGVTVTENSESKILSSNNNQQTYLIKEPRGSYIDGRATNTNEYGNTRGSVEILQRDSYLINPSKPNYTPKRDNTQNTFFKPFSPIKLTMQNTRIPPQKGSNNIPSKAFYFKHDLKSYLNLIGLGKKNVQISPSTNLLQNIRFSPTYKRGLKDIVSNPDFKTSNFRSRTGQRSRKRLFENRSLSRSNDRNSLQLEQLQFLSRKVNHISSTQLFGFRTLKNF